MADDPSRPSELAARSRMADTNDTDDALDELIRTYLVERTLNFRDGELVAYLAGWGSVLDLLRRTDLVFPGADSQARAALSELVERLRTAQYRALDSESRVRQ